MAVDEKQKQEVIDEAQKECKTEHFTSFEPSRQARHQEVRLLTLLVTPFTLNSTAVLDTTPLLTDGVSCPTVD